MHWSERKVNWRDRDGDSERDKQKSEWDIYRKKEGFGKTFRSFPNISTTLPTGQALMNLMP